MVQKNIIESGGRPQLVSSVKETTPTTSADGTTALSGEERHQLKSRIYQLENEVHVHGQCHVIPYNGKLSKEKTFADFEIGEPSAKVFSAKFLGHAAPTYDWFQAICESFLSEILTFYGSAKVSPSKVVQYCL